MMEQVRGDRVREQEGDLDTVLPGRDMCTDSISMDIILHGSRAGAGAGEEVDGEAIFMKCRLHRTIHFMRLQWKMK